MASFKLLTVCTTVILAMNRVFADEPIGCTEEYQKEVGHTLCKADSPDVTDSGVSDGDRKLIVDLHNELRSKVEPAAQEMTKMVWDDALAAVAQKLANQCIMKHDSYDERKILAYGISVGQNLAAGQSDWHTAIMAWYNEIHHFKYGEPPTGVTGHFAQIVFGHVDRVGCGFAYCRNSDYKRYYACNYGPGKTGIDADIRPYKNGERCTACPNSCKNGLCDCGGILCRNGGELDMDTCKCKCPSIYAGTYCETLACPETDGDVCGTQWPPSFCTKYENVKEVCPYMCNVCKYKNGCEWKWCKNNGKLKVDTCECECTQLYTGEHCEQQLPCPEKDSDDRCALFPKTYCEEYAAFMENTCPVLCGHCGKDEVTV